MPRLPEVGSAAVTDPFVKNVYQNKFGDREFDVAPGNEWGIKGNWETTMANSEPALASAVKSVAFMYDGENFALDLPLRELALLRVGWLRESKFVFSQRCKIGRKVGVTQEQIDAIPGWPVSDLFSPAERAVLAYTDALVLLDARVPDLIFNTVREFLGPRKLVELTHVVGIYIGFANISKAFKVEFDDRDDPIEEVPADPNFVPYVPTMDLSDAEKAEAEAKAERQKA